MTEINRFSCRVENIGFFHMPHTVRTIVEESDDGHYHIKTQKAFDDGTVSDFDNDIHGAMDKDAYIAWLTNALFNASYTTATKDEKIWLMG